MWHQSVHREAKAIFFLCPTVESAGENFYSDPKKKKNLNLHQPVPLDIYVEKTYGAQ